MWLRLLHCYLLPLITFHQEDLEAVALGRKDHSQTLCQLDKRMEEISSSTLKVNNAILFIIILLIHLYFIATRRVVHASV